MPRRCYPNSPAQSRQWVEREYGCLGLRKPLVIRVTVTGQWRWAKGATRKSQLATRSSPHVYRVPFFIDLCLTSTTISPLKLSL